MGVVPGIFVNYRTGDEPYGAGLLDRELSARFGSSNVFRAPKSIRPGTDFSDVIPRAVGAADALLVVIGPRWLELDSAGNRKIDRPDDWVRREIADAMDAGVKVFPLLFGTQRPGEDDLPTEIAGLARLQDIRIDHRNLGYDLAKLFDTLLELPRLAALSHGGWHSPRSGTVAGRDELDAYLSELLPERQQTFGNRAKIAAAIMQVVATDELVVYVAPCRFVGRAFGSTLALATNRCLYILEQQVPGRTRQVLKIEYYRIRRVVPHQGWPAIGPTSSVEILGNGERFELRSLLATQARALVEVLELAASETEPPAPAGR